MVSPTVQADISAAMADPNTLDQTRRKFVELVEKSGRSFAELSQALGKQRTYLHDYVNKRSPRRLSHEDRETLARLLNTSMESLAVAEPARNLPEISVARSEPRPLTFDSRDARFVARDLPILGHVRAGAMGVFIDNGKRQGVTVRPEALQGVPDAYAVRVHDTSMSPAVEPGWLLFVDPHRVAVAGDTVVVQLTDGSAFVKRLVRRSEKTYLCRQFNPEKEVRYDPAITTLHKVILISPIDL